MELNRLNLAHYVRVTRDENRLTNQTFDDTPFDHPVRVVELEDDYKFNRDSIMLICGRTMHIYDRKELTQWK